MVATPVGIAATPAAPKVSANPGAAEDFNDFSDSADWEWNLADEAEDPDFEIDADATSYYMPINTMVTFKVKALNGTPPYACSWNFADGSPEVKGEMAKHKFSTVGNYDVVVVCSDASGAKSQIQLGVLSATLDDWATRMHIDLASPSPAVTP